MLGKVIGILVVSLVWVSVSMAAPARVVSMNFCTDHLVQKIAGPGQLVSVSFLSEDRSASLIADEIGSYYLNHGLAEELLRLDPDLVIAGTYSNRSTLNMLRRLGIRVEEFAPALNFEDIRNNIQKVGHLLGREQVAAALVRELDAGLKSLGIPTPKSDRPPLLGIYTVNSYVTGADTLESNMTKAAGFRHMGSEMGLKGPNRLSMESLILTNPAFLLTWQRWSESTIRSSDMLRHPALKSWFGEARHFSLDQRYWMCGTPDVLQGVIALQSIRREMAQ